MNVMKPALRAYYLDSHIYFERSLLENDALERVQAVLRSRAAGWTSNAHVVGPSVSPQGFGPSHALRRSVEDAMQRQVAFNRRMSRALSLSVSDRRRCTIELTAPSSALTLLVDVDEKPRVIVGGEMHWANAVVLQVRKKNVEAETGWKWLRETTEAFLELAGVCYAHSECVEEFFEKNMVFDQAGLRAVGTDVLRHLPGVYWLNYFGPPYVRLLGRERLLSTPTAETAARGEGIEVLVAEEPDMWKAAEYERRVVSIRRYLGEGYFFWKERPSSLDSPVALGRAMSAGFEGS